MRGLGWWPVWSPAPGSSCWALRSHDVSPGLVLSGDRGHLCPSCSQCHEKLRTSCHGMERLWSLRLGDVLRDL